MRRTVPVLIALCLLVCGSFCSLLIAQAPLKRTCGTHIDWDALRADPVKWRQFQLQEKQIRDRMQQLELSQFGDANREYEIPVVFHIVDQNPDNITDIDIELQMAILNQDYEGLNDDSTNAVGFYPVRGHSKIRFTLAKRSPDGCDTNGITRTVSNLTITKATVSKIKYTSQGGHDAWDSYNCHYLNIWVGKFVAEPDGDILLGIATFPDRAEPLAEQGVVIGSSTFSLAGNAFTEGRTLVHEIGHYFNLRHIWGDENACAADDGIDDTPLQARSTSGNPAAPVLDICTTVAPGINFQNFMDYTNDQGLTMFTKKQVLRMVACMDIPERAFLVNPLNKALEPHEDNDYFNTCTTPVFRSNDFSAITVGKNGVVWAGSGASDTAQRGIYKFNGNKWQRYVPYSRHLVWDMKADQFGGVWIAQSGYTISGGTAQTGGLLYFPDTTFPATANYFATLDGLPSRYARSLFVDTSAVADPGRPLVWSAHFAQVTAGNSANGGIGRGYKNATPPFNTYRGGLNVSTQTQSVNAIAGNAFEIWAFAPSNYGKSMILRYSTTTNSYIDSIDATIAPGVFPSANFDIRAMHFDRYNRRWLGLTTGGIIINDGVSWQNFNSVNVIPAGTRINYNAITSDSTGNVYFGTNAGLLVYSANKPLTKDSSYKLYTTAHGLPGNNVKGVCVDTTRKRILLATDNGLVFWNPSCAQPGVSQLPYVSTGTGDWNNPSSWCGGVVPPADAHVIVKHVLTVTANASCKTLHMEGGSYVVVSAGVTFNIAE